MTTADRALTVIELWRRPGLAVLALRGDLSLRSADAVGDALAKRLVDLGRVLVDISGLRVLWLPATQILPSTLAAVGGWPSARLVLYGADTQLRDQLDPLRILDSVPHAQDRASAERLLQLRPQRVSRRHELGAEPSTARTARAMLRAACMEWEIEDTYDDAALTVTELVSNAVDHARTPSRLTLTLNGRGLLVAVRDGRPGPLPTLAPYEVTQERGRGLVAVEALSRTWGVNQHADGKTIWALLPTARAS